MPTASDPTNSTLDEVFALITDELHRQQNQIELIASENFTSSAVMKAQGSILTNKYAEGYPGRRYYGGCEVVDKIEQLAIDRAKNLFGCGFANVQPNSGSQANQAVFFATLSPGDKILGMSLAAGGHLTHGAPPNQSGKWFHAESYGVNADGWIDYDEIEQLAKHHQPKLLIAGGSAYPRIINFARMREIADSCGALLLVDMAHFAGLVAGKVYPSPFDYAHIVTTTTHKTLRGPRGGIILTNDADLAKKINSAIFPGIQGGPLMHVIAGKAIALKEAAEKSFQIYASNVVTNAKSLATTLIGRGYRLVSNGTDSHLILVNLTKPNGEPGITGKIAEKALEEAGLTCNKNGVPNDPLSPMITSGIRLGTPAGTTRGFGEEEFNIIGHCIADVLDTLNNNADKADPKVLSLVREKVHKLCCDFPLYNSLNQ
jgi:glycine hydroxymethyltransferase